MLLCLFVDLPWLLYILIVIVSGCWVYIFLYLQYLTADNNYVLTAADAQKIQRPGPDQGRIDNQDPNKRQSGK